MPLPNDHNLWIKSSILFLFCQLIILTASLCKEPDQEATTINVYIVAQKDSNDQKSPYSLMGNYIYNFLKEKIAKDSVKFKTYEIDSITTSGSLHTLISMENNLFSGIGIVQSDVLYHYLNGYNYSFPIKRTNSKIRAVSKIFNEWLFIYTDNVKFSNVFIDPIKQIGKVDGGPVGSGHLVTAFNVGNILHLPWDSYFNVLDRNVLDKQDTVLTLRVYSPKSALMQEKRENLLFLDEGSSTVLINSFPNVYHMIDKDSLRAKFGGDKSFIDLNDRYTIAVSAILITDRDLPKEILDLLYDDMYASLQCKEYEFENLQLNKLKKSISENIDSFSDKEFVAKKSENLPINRHFDLVKQDIDEPSKFFADAISKQTLMFFACVVAVLVLIRSIMPLIKNFRTERFSIRHYLFYLLKLSGWVGLFLAINAAIAIFIWLSEYYYSDQLLVNNKFIKEGVGGALKWLVAYLTMSSSKVQIYSIMGLFWVGFLKVSYAGATAYFSYTSIKAITTIVNRNRMKNHIIILGWNDIAANIIAELKAQGIRNFTVIAKVEKSKIPLSRRMLRYYIQLQNVQEDFALANMEQAKAIIVLADDYMAADKDDGNIDLRVIKMLDEIKAYLSDKKSKPRIVAEVKKYEDKKLAYAICADEVICRQSLGNELLAHCATKPNISKIFEELLITTNTHNEIYFDRVSSLDIQHKIDNFHNLQQYYHHNHPNRIPLGIFKEQESKIRLNPEGELVLGDDDKVIVLSKEKYSI